jgi:hypothetical protein
MRYTVAASETCALQTKISVWLEKSNKKILAHSYWKDKRKQKCDALPGYRLACETVFAIRKMMRRTSERLLHQDHLLPLLEFTRSELIEVNATWHVLCVPSYLMSTGSYLAVHQRSHFFPKCIVHLE